MPGKLLIFSPVQNHNGRSVIADNPAEPEVIDWRAPIASVYYDAALGDVSYSGKGGGKYDITLSRKRTYEIENDELKDFYDSDVVANDELLTNIVATEQKRVGARGEIIAYTLARTRSSIANTRTHIGSYRERRLGTTWPCTVTSYTRSYNQTRKEFSRTGIILNLGWTEQS